MDNIEQFRFVNGDLDLKPKSGWRVLHVIERLKVSETDIVLHSEIVL